MSEQQFIGYSVRDKKFNWENGGLCTSSGKEAVIEFLDYTLQKVFDEYHSHDSAVLKTVLDKRVKEFFEICEGFSFSQSIVIKHASNELEVEFTFINVNNRENPETISSLAG